MPTRFDVLGQNIGRHCGLAILVCFTVWPMAWVVAYSLAYSLGGVGLFSDGWTLRYWQEGFAVGGLKESLVYTLTIAGTVTVFATLGSLAVVLFAPQLRHSALALALLCIPLATPGAVLAFTVHQIMNPGGFLARMAYWVGLIESPTQFPALVNDPYAVGIVFAQTCGALPLLSLFFLNTWTVVHADRYCRLAESLGASRMHARRQIALPMLLHRGRPVILLIFLMNLGSYEVPLLLGRQSPQMFSVLTQRRFGQFDLLERPQAFALATTYLLLAGVGVQLLLRWRRSHA